MNHMFHGYDMDRTMLRIGAMNMMTHGIENPYIEYRIAYLIRMQIKISILLCWQTHLLKEAWMQSPFLEIFLRFVRQRKQNFYFWLCF